MDPILGEMPKASKRQTFLWAGDGDVAIHESCAIVAAPIWLTGLYKVHPISSMAAC